MDASFGIKAKPASLRWDDVRKGPPRRAVMEHLDLVARYPHHMRKSG